MALMLGLVPVSYVTHAWRGVCGPETIKNSYLFKGYLVLSIARVS